MVEIKTPGEIEAMRGAGQVVAQILAAVQDQAKAGMRLTELDEVARDVLARAGAFSPFLGYQPGFAPVPFPAAICTSVNDAALHGIPGRYKLADGDLLSVDCGAVLDGWAADAAVSFTIGPPGPGRRPPDRRHPGRPPGRHRRGGPRRADRGHLRGHRRRRARRGLRDLHRLRRPRRRPGHARGSAHPQRGRRPGAAAGWSPGWSSPSSRGSWPAAGTPTGSTRDGWTIRSGDGSRAAHAEHTVAVTEDGPRVLTVP